MTLYRCAATRTRTRARRAAHALLLAPNSRYHVPPQRPLHLTRFERQFAAVVAPPRRERITVPCRSNGHITISIVHASRNDSPVLVYLPPGPVVPDDAEADDRLVTALAASSQCTVARIAYRFSPEQQWPTPLHDVLHGYDWIRANLVDQSPFARLAVCGELVGGSLATSLALTECERGATRIQAAALSNPIADWVFPDDLPVSEPSHLPEPRAPEETAFPAERDVMSWWEGDADQAGQEAPLKAQKKQRRTVKPSLTAWQANGDNMYLPTLTMSAERDVLFTRAEQYFDRFASPIHFFRSPHGQLVHPHSDDTFASSPPDVPTAPLDIETQMDLSHYESAARSEATPEVPVLTRCRAYARIYPPSSSNLHLPKWHVTCGVESPLLDQASELAKMIKRGIARQMLRRKTARVMWQDPNEKQKYELYAEGRVHLGTTAGVGLWSLPDSPQWAARIHELGGWFRESTSQPEF